MKQYNTTLFQSTCEEVKVLIIPTRLNDDRNPFLVYHVAEVTLVEGIYILDFMGSSGPVTRTFNSQRYEIQIT